METLALKFDWRIYDLKNIRKVLSAGSSLHLTSERFSSPEFPSVAWELHLELKQDSSDLFVWLRQIGPDNINAFVNTKYKIYALKNSTCINITKSTYKFENPDEIGYTNISFNSVVQVDGRLYIRCEVEFDCYNLTVNLQDTYRKMLQNETFTDFVIKVDDKIIKAHRIVLAQNSQKLMAEAQKVYNL
ncbi:unnamed protein product [Meloidogyne enterolobii]|uniref:Uncharacterized protein n=1 Tax=Meloidogyne enterolobii TaxID=390850 RepID=A0ACB0Z2A5_MELEN